MAYKARVMLNETVKKLFDTGKYTDLLVTCGPDEYRVHRNVVCAQSGFFERAERLPVGKERSESRIDLAEDEPAPIKLYIRFLYEAEYEPRLPGDGTENRLPEPVVVGTEDSYYSYAFPHSCFRDVSSEDIYEPDEDEVCPHHTCCVDDSTLVGFVCAQCCPVYLEAVCPPGDASQLLLHANMYEIGDKYDTSSLKALALEKFSRACDRFWNDAIFARAAYHVFSTTQENDMGLRDIVSRLIADNLELLNKHEIEAVMTEFPGLAIGLLRTRARVATGKS